MSKKKNNRRKVNNTNQKHIKKEVDNKDINKNKEFIDENKNNENTKNLENDQKKKISIKDLPKDYIDFYKKNIKKKQIIFFIITVIFFGFTMYNYFSRLNNEEFLKQIQNISDQTQSMGTFKMIITNKIPIVGVLILAGITPYLYVSSLGVLTGSTIAGEILTVTSVPTHSGNVLLMTIGAIIQIIGFSLASANGFYWCNITGKRNKYSKSKERSFLDIRKEIYTLKGDKAKLKSLEKKKQEKIKEGEKYNIKVPFDMFIISFLISCIFITIGTLIFYI